MNEDRERAYELRNNPEFLLPAPRIEFFLKQPMYSLPYEWNNLDDVRFQNNKITFQINLKNNLLNSLSED